MMAIGGGVITSTMQAREIGGIELMLGPDRSLGYPILDADNHLYETPDALTKFLPPEYRSIIEYVEVNGRAKLAIDGKICRLIPNPTFQKVAPPGGQENDPQQRRSLASPDAFFEPGARLKLMHELGIERALMFPTLAGTVEQQLLHNIPAFHAVAHGFNQWMYEHWSYNYENAIFPVPMVPLSILEEGIKELEFVLERGAKVFWLRSGPVPTLLGPKSFALPEFDPFWKLVEEADVLVGMHNGDVGYNQFVNVWEGTVGKELRPFETPTSPVFRTLCTDYSTASAADSCAAIIGHGLASRFPKLRFAPIEYRGSWATRFVEQLLRAHEQQPSIFDENPLDVFKRNIFVHVFQERKPHRLIDLIGVDNVMFGSDFPHVEGLNDPLAYADFIQDLPTDDQAKIMGGNLARILKVGI
jgi:predicted TIM-barrel fold metal-dependent hydrolase